MFVFFLMVSIALPFSVALADVAEEIPTLVGRGRSRRRAYVDALSDDKADKEIHTIVGRGRGRVGGSKYFVLQHPQL